jgi:hypothetical protein
VPAPCPRIASPPNNPVELTASSVRSAPASLPLPAAAHRERSVAYDADCEGARQAKGERDRLPRRELSCTSAIRRSKGGRTSCPKHNPWYRRVPILY